MDCILKFYILLYLFLICESKLHKISKVPVVINTWAFTNATERAWEALKSGNPVDAVEAGCSMCEYMQCDGTVGYGGSPDENGETTLDAMIMDGENLNVGAVAGLRRIKHASSVARHVLENTKHSLLVGDQATKFAIGLGFKEETLQTSRSRQIYQRWSENNCQPNFWTNVVPDPVENCGPYRPAPRIVVKDITENDINFGLYNHDTIGLIAIDPEKRIAAGTSTNGANHKIPGRVGDSPIPGAGAYADNDVGAATATGDGDVMMRLLPSFLAVEEMRRGMTPKEAASFAIKRIIQKYPNFFGGVIAVNKYGDYGASCHGMERFPFSVRSNLIGEVMVETVHCVSPPRFPPQ